MGYALTGHPIRSHKRRKQRLHCHCNEYEGESRENRSRRRAKKRKAADAGKLTHIRAPITLQDLPVEILQRIYVLSGDMTAMPALNRYFHHHLQMSSHLLSEFLWEFYTFDYENHDLGDDISCPEGKVILVDSIFDNTMFYEFFKRNYRELSDHIGGYVHKHYVKENMLEEDKGLIIDTWNGDEPYDFPDRFYGDFEVFFLNCEMMHQLNLYFSYERPYEALEAFFQWLFKNLPDYVKSVHQINEVISHVMVMALRDEEDRIESVEPLMALITELFDNEEPFGVQLFVDKLFVYDDVDPKIKLLESILENWYSEERARKWLSDPFLWTELRRISNLAVIETIEKFGGEPHYDAFF